MVLELLFRPDRQLATARDGRLYCHGAQRLGDGDGNGHLSRTAAQRRPSVGSSYTPDEADPPAAVKVALPSDVSSTLPFTRIVVSWRDLSYAVDTPAGRKTLLHGVSGVALRAAGVPRDARVDHPYAFHRDLDFHVVTRSAGDALARLEVRCDEIHESLNLIDQMVLRLPGGPLAAHVGMLPPERWGMGLVESPRGVVVHWLRADARGGAEARGEDRRAHHRWQPPRRAAPAASLRLPRREPPHRKPPRLRRTLSADFFPRRPRQNPHRRSRLGNHGPARRCANHQGTENVPLRRRRSNQLRHVEIFRALEARRAVAGFDVFEDFALEIAQDDAVGVANR